MWSAKSHIERLLEDIPSHCTLVTAIDGHPATLAWLGSVIGHRTVSLGVEHFGQTGTIGDLYRHYGIDTQGIVEKVRGLTTGKPILIDLVDTIVMWDVAREPITAIKVLPQIIQILKVCFLKLQF